MRFDLIPMLQVQRDLYDIPRGMERFRKYAAKALAEAQQRLSHIPGEFRVGLVVADDAGGGWTNRYFSEFSYRFEGKPLLKRGWIVALFWTSEEKVREEVLMSITREVVHPNLDSADFPTVFACLYGDEAAKSVGYPVSGLSARAGLTLALAKAPLSRITSTPQQEGVGQTG